MRILLFVFLFISVQIFSQDSIKTKVYREKVGDMFVIYADNEEAAPASFEYSYTAENMSSSAENKKILIFKANSKKNVISELKHINKRLPTKFSYNVYSMMGDVNDQTFDENYIYSLPFDIKKEYRIDQGYNGNFSHQNSFSLDFNMKPGEKVFSAREGIVVKVVDQNDKSCLTKDCARYNNQIMILHSDGSFAEYVHLNKNGTAVKVNDSVKKCQLIGYSGGTGWAKGPHLHFSVFKNKMNGERNYIKTKFKTSAHNAGTLLEQGKTYSRTE